MHNDDAKPVGLAAFVSRGVARRGGLCLAGRNQWLQCDEGEVSTNLGGLGEKRPPKGGCTPRRFIQTKLFCWLLVLLLYPACEKQKNEVWVTSIFIWRCKNGEAG